MWARIKRMFRKPKLVTVPRFEPSVELFQTDSSPFSSLSSSSTIVETSDISSSSSKTSIPPIISPSFSSSSSASSSSSSSSSYVHPIVPTLPFLTPRKIDQGVYIMVHTDRTDRHQKPVILKTVKLDSIGGECLEVEIMKHLHKQWTPDRPFYIVELHHAKFELDKCSIYMEYCDGGNLSDFINNHYLRLEIGVKTRFVYDIIRGVEYLHQHNVAHRDIKLTNILLTYSEHRYICKIADFGLSTFVDGTLDAGDMGTVEYAAPEIFDGVRRHPFAPDIWALGVSIYAIYAACLPQPMPYLAHPNILEIPYLDILIRGCMIPNWRARYTIQHCVNSRFIEKSTNMKDLSFAKFQKLLMLAQEKDKIKQNH